MKFVNLQIEILGNLQSRFLAKEIRQEEKTCYLYNITRGIGLNVVDGTANGSRRSDTRHDAAGGHRNAPASFECAL